MLGLSHSLILCRLSTGFENPPSTTKKKKPNYSENIIFLESFFLNIRIMLLETTTCNFLRAVLLRKKMMFALCRTRNLRSTNDCL